MARWFFDYNHAGPSRQTLGLEIELRDYLMSLVAALDEDSGKAVGEIPEQSVATMKLSW